MKAGAVGLLRERTSKQKETVGPRLFGRRENSFQSVDRLRTLTRERVRQIFHNLFEPAANAARNLMSRSGHQRRTIDWIPSENFVRSLSTHEYFETFRRRFADQIAINRRGIGDGLLERTHYFRQ